jgi:hypothetical protein
LVDQTEKETHARVQELFKQWHMPSVFLVMSS